jgi:hypothetical protein
MNSSDSRIGRLLSPVRGACAGPGVRWWVACIAVLSVWACGNITAGGFGEVRVTVTGDAEDEHLSASATLDPRTGLFATTIAMDHDDEEDEPEGRLEFEFLAWLVRADGTLAELGDQEIEVEVDLSGFIERDAVETLLPAGRYVALRIEFTEVEVQVDAGVVIDGQVITGPIDIALEDDESITVERDVDLDLMDGGRIDILLDMNARTWLRAIDPDLKVVAERVFADAIAVSVR